MPLGFLKGVVRTLPLFLALSLVVNAGELFSITPDNSMLERVFLAGTGHDQLLAASRSAEGGLTVDAKRGAILIPFEQVSLEAVGSSVEVSYKAVFLNVDGSSRGLRLGLLGLANGSSIKENLKTIIAKEFAGAEGYFLNTRLASKSADQSEFYRRVAEAQNLFPGSESIVLGKLTEGLDISNGSEYQGRFSVSRTGANEMTITHEMDGRMAQAVVDTSGSFPIDFNLFTLFLSNAKPDETASRIIFSELKISSKP